MAKRSLKDSWWVLVVVPLVVALIPLVNTLIQQGKGPSDTTPILNTTFSGPMYFTSVSLIERQYQRTAGQPLNSTDLKGKLEDAGKLVANKNFTAAVPILEEVARRVPVAAVYNNLGVAYANSNDFSQAEEAFRQAVSKDSNDKAGMGKSRLGAAEGGEVAGRPSKFPKGA